MIRIILLILAILGLTAGVLLFTHGENIMHNIVGSLLCIIGSIFFSSTFILDAIIQVKRELITLRKQVSYEEQE